MDIDDQALTRRASCRGGRLKDGAITAWRPATDAGSRASPEVRGSERVARRARRDVPGWLCKTRRRVRGRIERLGQRGQAEQQLNHLLHLDLVGPAIADTASLFGRVIPRSAAGLTAAAWPRARMTSCRADRTLRAWQVSIETQSGDVSPQHARQRLVNDVELVSKTDPDGAAWPARHQGVTRDIGLDEPYPVRVEAGSMPKFSRQRGLDVLLLEVGVRPDVARVVTVVERFHQLHICSTALPRSGRVLRDHRHF